MKIEQVELNKKVFKPVTLQITLESKEEFDAMALAVGYARPSDVANSAKESGVTISLANSMLIGDILSSIYDELESIENENEL